jgi:hypothetical protein
LQKRGCGHSKILALRARRSNRKQQLRKYKLGQTAEN